MKLARYMGALDNVSDAVVIPNVNILALFAHNSDCSSIVDFVEQLISAKSLFSLIGQLEWLYSIFILNYGERLCGY
jgi:hypothetical protein